MKTRFLYILMSGFITLISCHKSDDFTGTIEVFDPPVLRDATPVQSKVKQMYNTYQVLFKPEFEPAEYSWNWENSVAQTAAGVTGLRYTPANPAYVIPVIDSVEKWVFDIFSLEFSRKYMPLNILLADTMENKYLSGVNIVHRIYEGYIATNYILLSYVSERFDDKKTKRFLRESWLSLFVEKMAPRIPVPADFIAISQAGYAKASFTNAEDVMVNYALLKKGRTKQSSGTATAAWGKTTPAQDFGDFVAFIVYTPQGDKEAAYSKNTAILNKVNLVKEYFKDNFDIELPYIPVEN